MARLLALLAVATLSSTARAGVTLTLESPTSTATMAIEGNKVRTDDRQKSGESSFFVFDGDAKTLLVGNVAERTYFVVTESQAKTMGARMQAEMEKAMREMPPEARAAAEQQLRGAKQAKATKLVPLGKKGTAAGHACEWFREMEGQRAVAEVCLIPWSAGVVRKDDFAAMEKAESMMRALSGGLGGEAGGIRAELEQAPGFPGRTVEIDEDGKRGEEEVLVKVERGSIPPDRFGPPSGFREGPSPF